MSARASRELGLDKTVKSLQALGLPILNVDTVLLALAVNALACLQERDSRYSKVIRLALNIALKPAQSPHTRRPETR